MATYTTLADVKTILNSCRRMKVRFSENSLKELKILFQDPLILNKAPIPLLTAIFYYNNITYDTAFEMNGFLRIKFTSATNFNVFEVNEKQDIETLIGSGDTSTEWNHPVLSSSLQPIMTIPITCWGTGFVAGAIVQLAYDTSLSSLTGEKYITETEIMIDQMLSKNMLVRLLDTGRTYTGVTVPQQISLATQYLSAYYIFVSLYSDTFIDKDKSLDYSLVRNWKAKAEELVKDYAVIRGRKVPSVVGFPTFMDRMGVDGEGPGFAAESSTVGDLTRDAQTETILSDS